MRFFRNGKSAADSVPALAAFASGQVSKNIETKSAQANLNKSGPPCRAHRLLCSRAEELILCRKRSSAEFWILPSSWCLPEIFLEKFERRAGSACPKLLFPCPQFDAADFS